MVSVNQLVAVAGKSRTVHEQFKPVNKAKTEAKAHAKKTVKTVALTRLPSVGFQS